MSAAFVFPTSFTSRLPLSRLASHCHTLPCKNSFRFASLPDRCRTNTKTFVCCSVKPTTSSPTQHFVSLPTGAVLELIVQLSAQNHSNSLLEKEKPALLFVHGSKHAAWAFRFFQPYFSQHGWDTYALSLRYAGQSYVPDQTQTSSDNQSSIPHYDSDQTSHESADNADRTKHKVSTQQLIVDLRSFLDTYEDLKSRRVVLLAHSLGGYLIQKLILDYLAESKPSLSSESIRPHPVIAGQVLLGAAPPFGNSALPLRVLFARGLRTAWSITRAFVTNALAEDSQLCRNILFNAKNDDDIVSEDDLQMYMRHFANNRLLVDARGIKPLSNHPLKMQKPPYDFEQAMPTLVVGGSEDIIVDAQAIEDTTAFWHAHSVVIQDAPHDLMLYPAWSRVAQPIHDWLLQNF